MLINEYVCGDAIDILAITETWLKRGGDSAIITELAPGGYGGGVGLLHRETNSCRLLASPCFKHTELLRARLTGAIVRSLNVYVMYHPSGVNQELGHSHLLHVLALVVGDFNIHYDDHIKADKLID